MIVVKGRIHRRWKGHSKLSQGSLKIAVRDNQLRRWKDRNKVSHVNLKIAVKDSQLRRWKGRSKVSHVNLKTAVTGEITTGKEVAMIMAEGTGAEEIKYISL